MKYTNSFPKMAMHQTDYICVAVKEIEWNILVCALSNLNMKNFTKQVYVKTLRSQIQRLSDEVMVPKHVALWTLWSMWTDVLNVREREREK